MNGASSEQPLMYRKKGPNGELAKRSCFVVIVIVCLGTTMYVQYSLDLTGLSQV